MSSDHLRSQLNVVARALTRLHEKMAASRQKEATAVARIGAIKRTMKATMSTTTLQAKQREIQGCERRIEQEKQTQAKIAREMAAKEKLTLQYEQRLRDELDKAQKRTLATLNEGVRSRIGALLTDARARASLPAPSGGRAEHDMFICHAAEDKTDVVRPLVERLEALGVDVWYDDFVLKVGDSLRRSIDAGLAGSRFGVVILSPAFFAKNWTQYELDGLVAKEIDSGSKVLLPIWHKVSRDEVMKVSPSLADKVALLTAVLSIDDIAAQLHSVLDG